MEHCTPIELPHSTGHLIKKCSPRLGFLFGGGCVLHTKSSLSARRLMIFHTFKVPVRDAGCQKSKRCTQVTPSWPMLEQKGVTGYCFARKKVLVVRSSSWSIYEAWPTALPKRKRSSEQEISCWLPHLPFCNTVVHAPYIPRRAARVIPVGAVGDTKAQNNVKRVVSFLLDDRGMLYCKTEQCSLLDVVRHMC